MTSWLKRAQSVPVSYPGSALTPAPTQASKWHDPNATDNRLDCESKCIYERTLPGSGYITAHVTRLQDGFYDSPATHGDAIDNVRFLAINFVFHPSTTMNRFQSATVTASLRDDTNQLFSDPIHHPGLGVPSHGVPVPARKPKFVRFAPHILFGGVSPETLDWNFNLAGTLGVSQGPATASVNPSAGMKSSYKIYQMMRIQGSTRTCRAHASHGTGYDIEDGEVVWTMEENALQKSGLPREMTFVMLMTKGDVENVVLDIKIEPKVATRYGHYPKWYCGLLKYQPLSKEHLDLDKQLGQSFLPEITGKGFNFANLSSTFNDFVSLPGTTYSVNDQAFRSQIPVSDENDPNKQSTKTASGPAGNSKDKQQQQQPQSGNGHSNSQQMVQPQPQAARTQQSAQRSEDEPMDYHIYLHNPRTINLHATPPPPAASAPPQLPNLANPLNATDPIPRPQTTGPERMRMASPANTRLKRRSINIGNMNHVVSPSKSQPAIRNLSGNSLRRSRSRTDLRSSPLVEDSNSHSSDCSQVSTPRSRSRRSNSNKENAPVQIKLPSQSPEIVEVDSIIPMEAPSPPGGGPDILSPPLPTSFSLAPTPTKKTRLPFEMRRNHSDKDRPNRPARARDSPSPMRKQREITPSPNESPESQVNSKNDQEASPPAEDEIIDMRTNDLTPIPIPYVEDNVDNTSSRRERTALRDISPYAYATTNGLLDEDWDDSKGDLKKMRARKRLSLPATAHYSYLSGPGDLSADKDWDER